MSYTTLPRAGKGRRALRNGASGDDVSIYTRRKKQESREGKEKRRMKKGRKRTRKRKEREEKRTDIPLASVEFEGKGKAQGTHDTRDLEAPATRYGFASAQNRYG
jgi:hypothetical protein